MRVDLNRTAANEVAAEQRTKQVAANGRPSAHHATEDQATFSTDSIAISDLAAQAMQTPEIRQSKVDSLRDAIHNGTYKVDPAAVADAMLKGESE